MLVRVFTVQLKWMDSGQFTNSFAGTFSWLTISIPLAKYHFPQKNENCEFFFFLYSLACISFLKKPDRLLFFLL